MLILNLPPVTLITQEFIMNRSGRKILGRPQRRRHQKSLRTPSTVALAESNITILQLWGLLKTKGNFPRKAWMVSCSQFHSISSLSTIAVYPSATPAWQEALQVFLEQLPQQKALCPWILGITFSWWLLLFIEVQRWVASFHLPLLQALPTLVKVTSREI